MPSLDPFGPEDFSALNFKGTSFGRIGTTQNCAVTLYLDVNKLPRIYSITSRARNAPKSPKASLGLPPFMDSRNSIFDLNNLRKASLDKFSQSTMYGFVRFSILSFARPSQRGEKKKNT